MPPALLARRRRIKVYGPEESAAYAGDMDAPGVKRVARASRTSTLLRFLARAGFAVNGVVNAIIGFLAIGIAVTGGGSADQSGAFGAIAATPGGMLLLWITTIALAALGLWYLLGVFLPSGRDPQRRAAKIAMAVGKGAAYLLLAGAAFGFVRGAGGSGSGASQTTSLTAELMAAPGGILVVMLIGLLFMGVGIYMAIKGLTRRFTRDLVLPRGAAAPVVRAIGVFGYVARGVALFVVGVLFIVASATFDPSKATGLDGALKALAGLPFGKLLLAIVGLGFIAYGVYSAVRARLAYLG